MSTDSIPVFSVQELNEAIGNLLERGFAPRFLLNASVSKSQIKKGHLWLTLTDGTSSITAVVWASRLARLNFKPKESDGVVVVGKLNFWTARATLAVQVLDIRPTISTVLRKFELVRKLLLEEGLIDTSRRRKLPAFPRAITILTSVPSSALADMLRTAKERWPLTKVYILPIPVQGQVEKQIQMALHQLSGYLEKLEVEAIVLARGGGSREDLMVFDSENLCRDLANFPVPVVTGLGHEDDLLVADLVADHRSATPTAAIVDLLPSREVANAECLQRRKRLSDYCTWFICKEKQNLLELREMLLSLSPINLIKQKRIKLREKQDLLNALSPDRWLKNGFAIVTNQMGKSIRGVNDVSRKENLTIHVTDGQIQSIVDKVNPN